MTGSFPMDGNTNSNDTGVWWANGARGGGGLSTHWCARRLSCRQRLQPLQYRGGPGGGHIAMRRTHLDESMQPVGGQSDKSLRGIALRGILIAGNPDDRLALRQHQRKIRRAGRVYDAELARRGGGDGEVLSLLASMKPVRCPPWPAATICRADAILCVMPGALTSCPGWLAGAGVITPATRDAGRRRRSRRDHLAHISQDDPPSARGAQCGDRGIDRTQTVGPGHVVHARARLAHGW
jgi:hypothetical protein